MGMRSDRTTARTMLVRTADRIRRATAWAALAAIAALVLVPALAFAQGLLVSEYAVPSEAAPGDDQSDGWYVTEESALGDPVFNAGTLRGADGSNGLDWSGSAEVDARVVGRGYRADASFTPFTSFEDFAARSSQVSLTEDYLYRALDDPSLRTWSGAQRTTLGGLEAYVNRASVRLEYADGVGDAEYGETWVYWIPAGAGSGILVRAHASVWWSEAVPPTSGEHHGHQLDPLVAEVESVLASLRFHPLDGTSAGAGVPGASSGGTSPWRTVAGGLAAVAAAAVALAGAAASTRAKTGAEEPPPHQPVGYVLQLSGRSLQVSAQHAVNLSVQAFAVMPDGSYRPATDAAIIAHPPAGVSVQPQTAYGTLQASVWATGALAAGSAITVEAQASLGMTTASVGVSAAGESRIVTRIEPAGTLALRTQAGHAITLVAAVELLGADAADGTLDAAAIKSSIAFAEDSEWLEVSEPADYEDGRAITVMASQPDPTSPVQPPESATVRVTAWIGDRPLEELVTIPLARLPEIEAEPDEVALAAESGAAVEVAVTITNAGDTPWQFSTEWREGSRAIASADISPTGPAAATLTITESGSENLDPTRPETASTLVVIATAEGFDELRRKVEVVVTQEGLFIDRTNVDPSTGAFPLAADGSGRTTAIDLRVFVRDPATGEIGPDVALAEQASLEIGGQEGTSGFAGLHAAGLAVTPAGVRQLNVPSATFDVALERKLPTAGEPVPAALLASVPGHDAERFSALVPLRLLGVDMEPYSDVWETERDNCLDMIRGFVPFEHQDRLYALVAERSLTMGAEGLFYMRKQIWSFAYDQLMIQKHEHLDAAWWYQQVEDTLEWVSWCGDIALGVISGTAVGVVGSIALGMLKPLLVSAMEVWLAGGSLEDWLLAQTSTLTGVLEGSLTDPDFLTTLSGEKKAIGWALFIAYYFAKELYNDPQLSVTNAMKNVARQLRDEGLVRFLQMIAGMKGITPKAPDADAGTPKTPAADGSTPKTPAEPGTPDAAPGRPKPDAGAPDGTTARTPDADAGRAPDTPSEVPRTGDADQARPASAPDAGTPGTRAKADGETPRTDADASKPADADTADTQKAGPEGDAEAAPDPKPAPEGDAPKAPEKPAEKTPEAPEAPAADAPKAPDPRRASADPAARAASMADEIAAQTRDGGRVDRATVERIMRDPDAMRKLRESDPDAYRQMHETRQEIYNSHDARLRDWIAENVPEAEGREVAIQSVGHADGIDRDYRAGYMVRDANGQQRFIEIPKERWAGESQRIFAEETGGPTDPSGAARWAETHQQLQTDQYHAQASVDMADQATVYNPETGTWERTQVTPNYQMVHDGRSTFLDPEGYGRTFETKVAESYHAGNQVDAYHQAHKAVESLDCSRRGYSDQGYDVRALPPKVAEGMQVIRDVESGAITPAEAETRLRGAGYSDLPDFMEKVSGQFAGFKWARKK